MYKQVLEFHRTFGHPERPAPGFISAERVAMRREWQRSERSEFKHALMTNDLVGAADAIADEIYFLVGLAVEMGIPLGKVYKAVHAANMRKVWKEGPHALDCNINRKNLVHGRCTCGKLRYTDVGRVLKPEGWIGPDEDIRNILIEHGAEIEGK